MTGDELKEIRKKLGLKQSKLAETLGINVMFISNWERGVSAIPAHLGDTLDLIQRWYAQGDGMTGDELKAIRKEMGLNQAGLAKTLGISGTTVSNWERGISAIPPYLGFALDWIRYRGGGPVVETRRELMLKLWWLGCERDIEKAHRRTT